LGLGFGFRFGLVGEHRVDALDEAPAACRYLGHLVRGRVGVRVRVGVKVRVRARARARARARLRARVRVRDRGRVRGRYLGHLDPVAALVQPQLGDGLDRAVRVRGRGRVRGRVRVRVRVRARVRVKVRVMSVRLVPHLSSWSSSE
jgi:hypothetical protein